LVDEHFNATVKDLLAAHPHITARTSARMGDGKPLAAIESRLSTDRHTCVYLRDGTLIGCIHAAHDEDSSLDSGRLVGNLACKPPLRWLSVPCWPRRAPITDHRVVLNSGRKRGDRYQQVVEPGQGGGGDVRLHVGHGR